VGPETETFLGPEMATSAAQHLLLLEECTTVIFKLGIPLDKLLMVFFKSSNPIGGMADHHLQAGIPLDEVWCFERSNPIGGMGDSDLQAGIPLDKSLIVFFESSNPIGGMADSDLQAGIPLDKF
jgi:hypothetical protein